MATSQRRTATPTRVPAGAEDEPRETATQDDVPLPANTEGMSVPEVDRTRDMSPLEMDEEEPETPAEPEKITFVRYMDAQHFEERRITKRDFERAGVQDAEDVAWTKQNGHMVRKDKLMSFMDEGQYAAIILADTRFEEVEA